MTMFKRLLIALCLLPLAAQAEVTTGAAAPDFTATDVNGKQVQLSQLKGSPVVLEWTNPECPFVVKHYKSDNMQKLQEEITAQGVVWITVNSSADGKQGNLSNEEAQALMKEQGWHASHLVLDADGTIGRQYGAKTTPHMFVIDADGKVVYQGAIDSIASADPADIAKADNYVRDAIAAVKGGGEIAKTTTQPYGCSVKYGS